MRIFETGRRHLVGEDRRDWRTASGYFDRLPYVQLASGGALLALVATQVVGTLGAACFVLAFLVVIAVRPLDALNDLLRFSPLLLLPILAMISALWSPAPQITLRAAIQIVMTVAAAILIARRLSPQAMVLLLYIGYMCVCLLILPTAPDSLASGSPLSSPFLGSKNQVGFAGHMLIALGIAVAVDRKQPMLMRLVALASLPAGGLIVYLSQSAGALASLMITALTFPPLLILTRVKPTLRVVCLLVAVVGLCFALLFLPSIEDALTDLRVNVLKKDATLTGRTYLWDVAAQISAKRPWLGEGYGAFWRHGNLDAEGLWRWGGIATRSGFNFHNAYIEMRVDLGWTGMTLLIALCVGIAFVGLARHLIEPSVVAAFFLSLMAVLYARSFSESSLIAPFSVVTVAWIAMAIYALAPRAVGSPTPDPRPRRTIAARKTLTTARRL